MPYIKKRYRPHAAYAPRLPGELNFAITSLLIHYVLNNGMNYASINDCLGALEGAKQEFYRRVAAPYEDTRIAENGDVYPNNMLNGGKP